jgi:signal transduction histidine kinase
MRLAKFILENRELILREWEEFARTCAPASGTMDVAALRDHADQMLTVIATDLGTPQGHRDQSEKSRGLAEKEVGAIATAAEEHGAGRAESGFSVEQMVAEYRALRASVLRLWRMSNDEWLPEDVQDLIRFNEAIDQSLAESVTRFTDDLEQSKETFLAILGHDLRTPLGAISTSARFMLELGELEEPYRTLIDRIANSSSRTIEMVGDLLDFTRSRLGGIPVTPAEMNMGRVARHTVDEILSAHPGSDIGLETIGELRGCWDEDRIGQALSNLIGNAVQHGVEGTKVSVKVRGEDDHVEIAVHNHGVIARPEQLDGLFNPLKKRSESRSAWGQGPTGSLGLGLYIAERIVNAHHGRIDVESAGHTGTTFTVVLPRSNPTEQRRP